MEMSLVIVFSRMLASKITCKLRDRERSVRVSLSAEYGGFVNFKPIMQMPFNKIEIRHKSKTGL